MIMHRDHRINAGCFEHLSIEQGGECLAIKFLKVGNIAIQLHFTKPIRTTILGAIEKIGFDQHYATCSIVLCRTGKDQIAHSAVVAASISHGYRTNQHHLAIKTTAHFFQIIQIRNKARAKFGVRIGLERNGVGDVFTNPDILGHIDSKRIVGEGACDNKTVGHRVFRC